MIGGAEVDVKTQDQEVYNDILKFDTVTETWKQVGQLAKARANHAMSLVNIEDINEYCI